MKGRGEEYDTCDSEELRDPDQPSAKVNTLSCFSFWLCQINLYLYTVQCTYISRHIFIIS